MSISKEKMQGLDARAIEGFGIPSLVLMENAAMGIFFHIKDKFNSYTIVCGTGNNGGDGLALARHLVLHHKSVEVFLTGQPKSPESSLNLEILQKLSPRVYFLEGDLTQLKLSLQKSQVCLDGLFGIGLEREVEGFYGELIDLINDNSAYIVSIDIPSGLEADRGIALNKAIKPQETLAIHQKKMGMEEENSGKISEIYIGIPPEDFNL